MSSNKIEELKKRRKREFNKKKSQIPYAIVLIVLAMIVYGLFLKNNLRYSVFWIIGILLGITLQRSRFCFTASFRDPILVGSTSILKAIIIAFIISTIGFATVQYISIQESESFDVTCIPGQIHPVGFHTIIGAIMFGIGMVIAGGCASGTLMRIGEGFLLQMIVLVGFIIGTLLGARHFVFWDKLIISKSPIIYIPEFLGFFTSVVIQVIVLIVLYFLADRYDKKNSMMSM